MTEASRDPDKAEEEGGDPQIPGQIDGGSPLAEVAHKDQYGGGSTAKAQDIGGSGVMGAVFPWIGQAIAAAYQDGAGDGAAQIGEDDHG